MQFKTIILISFLFILFSCEKEAGNNTQIEEENKNEYIVSKPLRFDTVESLRSSVWTGITPIDTRAPSSFVSFAETVMLEPGYEDRPNAILSERFGSILNSEGEVEFADYMLKVTDVGIIYAPVNMRDYVMELSEDADLLFHCVEKVEGIEINPLEAFYKIDSYDGIYLYDTFHLLSTDNLNLSSTIETKVISTDLVPYTLNGPLYTFTTPPAGSQKVLFYDTQYCNDTKVFQQNYGILSDGGLKTKTMEKGALGTWHKISNPIEGGIAFFTVFEFGTFDGITATTPDINKVKYSGKAKYVYTISARGTTPQSHIPTNVSGLINQGNTLALNNGLSITVEGIRFVLNDANAVTVFPDIIDSGTYEKIDYNWPVPINGDTHCTQSYLGHTPVPNYASYYVVAFLAYGQSTRGFETRGSSVAYGYW